MRLWVASLVCVVGSATAVLGQQESRSEYEQLDRAKQLYVAVMEDARKELLVALEGHVKKVAETGDLDAVRQVLAAKESLEKNGNVPLDSPVLAPVLGPYQMVHAKAAESLVKSYEAAIRELTRQLKIEEATALQAEMKAFQRGELTIKSREPQQQQPLDPIQERLLQAKQEYEQAVGGATTVAIGRMEDRLKELQRQGNTVAADKVKAELQQWGNNLVGAESDDSGLRSALAAFNREVTAAERRLNLAYAQAISQAKRERKTELAEALELDREDRELNRPVPGDSPGWFRLFRSTNPKHWNTNHRAPGERAVTVDQAPDGMKYLRIRLIDKQNYDVILPMEKFYLAYSYRTDRYTWYGENTFDDGAYHLGITSGNYRLERMSQRGATAIGPPEDRPLLSGWGFGHRYRINNGQGYCWQGRTLPGPVLIEISVSPGPLNEAEQKALLEP